MKIKRIIALLMVLTFAIPLVACQSTEQGTQAPSTAGLPETPGTSEETAPSTKAEIPTYDTPLKSGTYEVKHNATGTIFGSDKYGAVSYGDAIQYSQVSIDWVVNKGEAYYRLGLFGIEQKKHKESQKIFENIEVLKCVAVKQAKTGAPVGEDHDSLSQTAQMWKLYPNDDGTFCIASALRPTKSRLGVVDGKIVLLDYKEGDDLTNLKWSFTSKSTDNPIYYEYVSEKGNAIVRVPRDVFESKNYTAAFDKDTGKVETYAPTPETLQQYAENVQLTYDTYVELTNFIPYNVIIVHGYNYQGVMAGVVGGNNNVFVNCGPGEWFYSDLMKMEYRMTKLGKNDVNFMVLHEIGHMFDFDRGWNFESEMEADLKAAYLLHTVEGSYAAPAEYERGTCFSTDIGTKGYNGLSGGAMTTKYSIYRNAEIFTALCANETGWEALKKTFHWFQSEEGKSQCSSSEDRYTKFKTFVDKLSEFGGTDLWSKFNSMELAVLEKEFGKPEETEEPAGE